MRISTTFLTSLILASLSAPIVAHAEDVITVQSTTSTRDSGLYDFILPKFKEVSGITVNVVSVGTGQAIRNARDCNGDVLLVHSKPDEEKFVADGYGIKRHDLMYNDFVIIGPNADPAGIKGMTSVMKALQRLAETESSFASRGDDSGTNKAELRLWEQAGIDPKPDSGEWYLETGSGMGKTLNVAVGRNAYVMSDRATWTKYGNKQDHVIVVEGDPPLFNQYGVAAVNPEKCPDVKVEAAGEFVNWLISDEGQKAIGDYRIGDMQVFFPNAEKAMN